MLNPNSNSRSEYEDGETKFLILRQFPSPEIEKAWLDCLSRVDLPSCYCSPDFFREPAWSGKSPFAVLAFSQGSITGVLTGLHEGDQVISGLQSRPQICVDTNRPNVQITLDNLARGLLAEARRAKLIAVYTWSWLPLSSFQAHGFRVRPFEGNVVLDLTKGKDALLKSFHKSRKSNIRSAIRQGVEVFQAANLDDADAFHRLYLEWRKTSRKEIKTEELPSGVFEQRFRSGYFRFFLARHSGRVIAGSTLRFFPGGMVEYANNSSLEEFLHLRPNDLLQWRAIEWACDNGFKAYSMGGAHFFLRGFGGAIVPVHRYRLDQTFLRQYDLREASMDLARIGFRSLPHPAQKIVRRLVGSTQK